MYRKVNALKDWKKQLEIVRQNEKFKELVCDRYRDNVMEFDVGEIVTCLKPILKDWEIDFYSGSYVRVNLFDETSSRNKLDEALDNIKDYAVFSDDDLKYLERVRSAYNRFVYMSYSNKQYDNLEDWLYKQQNKIKYIIENVFSSLLRDADEECSKFIQGIDSYVDDTALCMIDDWLYYDTKTLELWNKQPMYCKY